jgi:hypothetical protein
MASPVEQSRRGMLDPAGEFARGYEYPAAHSDDADLVDLVLVEVVAADAEGGRCFFDAEREA